MFYFSSFQPSKVAGIIKFKKRPSGLGNYEDIDGNTWNINAIIGNIVCAVKKESLHPYYTDTSNSCFGFVSQTWKPYFIHPTC